MKLNTPSTRLVAALALLGALAGCAPLIVGGAAVGTALMSTDRRSTGAQIDDEAIELRTGMQLREALGDQVHINVTSYNRQVLLTGEVPNDAARTRAEQIAGRIDNVRGIVNELVVAPPTSLAERSGDTLVTGKVRASFVDAQDLQANTFKVVTERGVVYLMGRVTQREADRGTSIARGISGVNKVVRMFEIVTPQEIEAGRGPAPAPAATVAPAPAPAPAPAAQPSGGAVATPVR